MSLAYQTSLPFVVPDTGPPVSRLKLAREGSFVDNMKLPVHRWFRYSAGFSADWAVKTIANLGLTEKSFLLDPFAGSGTTLIAAESAGINAVGFETHPFVLRVASAKLLWNINTHEFLSAASEVLKIAQKNVHPPRLLSAPLLSKCYSHENLSKLEALRNAYSALKSEDPLWELIWLAITGILRSTSSAGTAQWQYVLPNKSKINVIEPFAAFHSKVNMMAEDMRYAQTNGYHANARLLACDAREPKDVELPQFDALITSPPYPNNYDYADATRLELAFWGEVSGWSDLHDTIRTHLIRSCSQHSAAERLNLDALLETAELQPIRKEISSVCNELAVVRLSKGGRKTYHTMIAAYFLDMAKVFKSLRPAFKAGSTLCFIIGDSAPYGVYAPVDEWLGKLSLVAGFKNYSFEKIRDRNIKWKNRKHRVPLKEGRLWIEG